MGFVAIIIFVVTIAAIAWERFHITPSLWPVAWRCGQPLSMLILLAAGAAVASAFLNHRTTVMLVAPVAVMAARALEVDAVLSRWCR